MSRIADHSELLPAVSIMPELIFTTRKAACVIVLVVSVDLPVCLPVCLSDDNFRKRGRRKFIFAHERRMNE